MSRRAFVVPIFLSILVAASLLPAVAGAQSFVYMTQWGTEGSGPGEFSPPAGVAVAPTGEVYVTDLNNHRVQVFSGDGTHLYEWGTYGSGDGQFMHPRGVALDGGGNVYVTDSVNHRIQVFTSGGTYLRQWGTYGTGNGQFHNPFDVALDGSGNV